MTAVWRCEPRSHGRNKAATPLPGRTSSVTVPHRSASRALCPFVHAASFRRRGSSFVRGVWRRRRCYRRRRKAGGRGACTAQCGVWARAVVLWLRLMQRRRMRSDSPGARRAGPARCGRGSGSGSCVLRARWAQKQTRVFLFSCKRGAVERRTQRACTRGAVLMLPQAAGHRRRGRGRVAHVLGACSHSQCGRRGITIVGGIWKK